MFPDCTSHSITDRTFPLCRLDSKETMRRYQFGTLLFDFETREPFALCSPLLIRVAPGGSEKLIFPSAFLFRLLHRHQLKDAFNEAFAGDTDGDFVEN
ncbi:hypothetical protein CEXT_436871 [Caerostris extrusa]|uniref:Uncharacterized protein n=1 Tax=Caerostris extrusa TaxID=172846 RepID=A0AAV4XE42_CAEEX|nr:hypothetical protein CEXT_436871 [Caerostris extrusa]